MREYLRNLWDDYGMLIPLFAVVFTLLFATFGLAYLAVTAPDTYYVTLKDGTIIECVSPSECNWQSGR